MISAALGARIKGANTLLEARESLLEIRSLICFDDTNRKLINEAVERIDKVATSVMTDNEPSPF